MSLLSHEWLQSLHHVIAPGESLKYDETYVDLKNKMSQVTFNADEMITLASGLLMRSVDWQLCQFLLLACAAKGHLDDFLIAMQAYAVIVAKSENAYPRTSKGRQAAVYWLNQSSIIELLQQHKSKITPDRLSQCKASWEKLQTYWNSDIEADHLSWHVMGKWLASCRPVPAEIATKAEVAITMPSNAIQTIEDDRQAFELANLLWEYHWKKGNRLKAICLSRSDAWSRFAMPQEQFGKTFIEPLRAAEHQKMQALFAQGKWEGLWESAELCFQQMGGPFDVRIQYYIIHSIEQLNLQDELIWAKSFFINRLKVFPQWLDMHFNDGGAFCDDSVRCWALSLNAPDIIKVENVQGSPFESTAIALKMRQFDAALWLNEFVPASHFDTAWHRYLWVLRDHMNKKFEQAWRGYEALIFFCKEKSLYDWDSKLMKNIWQLGVEMSEKKGVRYEQLLNQIIQYDVNFAGEIQ